MSDHQTPTEPDPATAADPAAAEPAAAADPATLLESAKAEIADLKDQALRYAAEVENTRRRLERERETAVANAAGRFAKDILSVADNLRRALEAAPAEAEAIPAVKNLVLGVEMTGRELLSVFERHGIKPIAAKGQRFDPNLHEALFEVEDASVPAGTVVQELQQGFTIGGRLLRAAQVGVAKGGPKADQGVDTKA